MKLPGILSVSVVPAVSLPKNIYLLFLAGVDIAIPRPQSRLLLYGDAECTIEEKAGYGASFEEVEMKFSTLSFIDAAADNAFLVECVSGDRYLIGQREGPYPAVTVSETVTQERHVYNVKVTLEGKKVSFRAGLQE